MMIVNSITFLRNLLDEDGDCKIDFEKDATKSSGDSKKDDGIKQYKEAIEALEQLGYVS